MKAIDKLTEELKSGKFDNHGRVMKDAVYAALCDFCHQNAEFAEAVEQGGTLEECLKEVAKGIHGGAISDLDAFKRAVEFYFKGADVKFQMVISLANTENETDLDVKPVNNGMVINLEDFL